MIEMSNVLSVGKWLRKYAVLIIILTVLVVELVSVGLHGQGPRPQLPPNGYVTEQGSVTLQWNEGNIEKPITLQISKSGDFEELILDQKVNGQTHNYGTNLERGQTYYWRLMQEDVPSPVSRFTVSEQHVKL